MFSKRIQTCNAVLTVLSVKLHKRLTEQEHAESHEHMLDLIKSMDDLGIPWKLQNALFYVAEMYDVRKWYLDQLLKKAIEHARVDGAELFGF